MKKRKFLVILPGLMAAVLILGACSFGAGGSPTEAVNAVYTAAAETIIARATNITATPVPSQTPLPTSTPIPSATPTATITQITSTPVTQNYCDNSLYISDVTIPDHTVMAPGQVFDKTWKFKNTGSCTWTQSYTITYYSGDKMNGEQRSILVTVAPQEEANITVRLTAPTKPGDYTGSWILANSKGQSFGQFVWVIITVSDTAPTFTPTPGGTSEATSTAVPATSTPTSAVNPTNTISPTVQPSATTP